MERTLLSVEPAHQGWRVRLRGLVLDEKPTQFDERLLEAERDAVLALWSAVFPTA